MKALYASELVQAAKSVALDHISYVFYIYKTWSSIIVLSGIFYCTNFMVVIDMDKLLSITVLFLRCLGETQILQS